LDEELLREIATETGARYFNVQDPDGLDSALEEINTLEKTTVTTDVVYRYNELYLWFLIPSLALLISASFINMSITGRMV
jgi:Ca-activated chloride channel family protein